MPAACSPTVELLAYSELVPACRQHSFFLLGEFETRGNFGLQIGRDLTTWSRLPVAAPRPLSRRRWTQRRPSWSSCSRPCAPTERVEHPQPQQLEVLMLPTVHRAGAGTAASSTSSQQPAHQSMWRQQSGAPSQQQQQQRRRRCCSRCWQQRSTADGAPLADRPRRPEHAAASIAHQHHQHHQPPAGSSIAVTDSETISAIIGQVIHRRRRHGCEGKLLAIIIIRGEGYAYRTCLDREFVVLKEIHLVVGVSKARDYGV